MSGVSKTQNGFIKAYLEKLNEVRWANAIQAATPAPQNCNMRWQEWRDIVITIVFCWLIFKLGAYLLL